MADKRTAARHFGIDSDNQDLHAELYENLAQEDAESPTFFSDVQDEPRLPTTPIILSHTRQRIDHWLERQARSEPDQHDELVDQDGGEIDDFDVFLARLQTLDREMEKAMESRQTHNRWLIEFFDENPSQTWAAELLTAFRETLFEMKAQLNDPENQHHIFDLFRMTERHIGHCDLRNSKAGSQIALEFFEAISLGGVMGYFGVGDWAMAKILLEVISIRPTTYNIIWDAFEISPRKQPRIQRRSHQSQVATSGHQHITVEQGAALEKVKQLVEDGYTGLQAEQVAPRIWSENKHVFTQHAAQCEAKFVRVKRIFYLIVGESGSGKSYFVQNYLTDGKPGDCCEVSHGSFNNYRRHTTLLFDEASDNFRARGASDKKGPATNSLWDLDNFLQLSSEVAININVKFDWRACFATRLGVTSNYDPLVHNAGPKDYYHFGMTEDDWTVFWNRFHWIGRSSIKTDSASSQPVRWIDWEAGPGWNRMGIPIPSSPPSDWEAECREMQRQHFIRDTIVPRELRTDDALFVTPIKRPCLLPTRSTITPYMKKLRLSVETPPDTPPSAHSTQPHFNFSPFLRDSQSPRQDCGRSRSPAPSVSSHISGDSSYGGHGCPHAAEPSELACPVEHAQDYITMQEAGRNIDDLVENEEILVFSHYRCRGQWKCKWRLVRFASATKRQTLRWQGMRSLKPIIINCGCPVVYVKKPILRLPMAAL